MSAIRRLTEAEVERIVEMREAGSSISRIAAAIGCSVSAVQYHCLKHCAEPPKPPRVRPSLVEPQVLQRGGHVVRRFTDSEDGRLLELEAEGLGDCEIARRLGRPPNSVRGRLMTLARRDARLEACG